MTRRCRWTMKTPGTPPRVLDERVTRRHCIGPNQSLTATRTYCSHWIYMSYLICRTKGARRFRSERHRRAVEQSCLPPPFPDQNLALACLAQSKRISVPRVCYVQTRCRVNISLGVVRRIECRSSRTFPNFPNCTRRLPASLLRVSVVPSLKFKVRRCFP
jgi:hypothetical protein